MTTPLKVLIIDDEINEIIVLKEKLKLCDHIEVVATSRNIQEGSFLILKHRPDLVLLDISMPDGSGFDLLNVFQTIDFGVIFVTGYEEYAVQALEFSSLQYLLKPVKIGLLKAAIEQFRKNGKASEAQLQHAQYVRQDIKKIDRIFLPKRGVLQMVLLEEISYLEADGAITHIYTHTNERFTVSKQLGQFEVQLKDTDIFYRINAKYLINTNQIKSIIKEDNSVIMTPKTPLAIAAAKKSFFFQFLKDKGWM